MGYEVFRDFINVDGVWYDNQDNSNYGWDMYFSYLNPTNPEATTTPSFFDEIIPVGTIVNFGFTLQNLGGVGTPDLAWSASSGDGWIQNITPASGSIPAGGSAPVAFDINTNGLVPFTNYSGSIVISSNDPLSPYTLPVDLFTSTTPALGLSSSGNFADIAVSNHGVLGDYDVQGYTYDWGGNGAVNYGGTFILGNSPTGMMLEYGVGVNNNDYRAIQPLILDDPMHPTGGFDDGGTLYGGLAVGYAGEGFTSAALADTDDFYFHKYVITNNSGAPITGLLTGLYFDWDIGGTDVVTFNRPLNLLIQGPAGGPYYGLCLLSHDVNTLMGVSNLNFIYPQQGWNAETLYTYMNMNADMLPATYADMSSMLSFGPFDLDVAESETLVFAIIGGASEAEVIAGAELAELVFIGGPEGCAYTPGDISGAGGLNGGDVVYGVSYFKYGVNPPPDTCPLCPDPNPYFAAGDVNGNCVFNGVDVTYLLNYFKYGVNPVLFCPTCPPAEPAPAVVPRLRARDVQIRMNE